jgi:hypothetical protein
MTKNTNIQLTTTYKNIPAGSKGKVVAVREVKETDQDYIALKQNGVIMKTGNLAMVKFGRKQILVPISLLQSI